MKGLWGAAGAASFIPQDSEVSSSYRAALHDVSKNFRLAPLQRLTRKRDRVYRKGIAMQKAMGIALNQGDGPGSEKWETINRKWMSLQKALVHLNNEIRCRAGERHAHG